MSSFSTPTHQISNLYNLQNIDRAILEQNDSPSVSYKEIYTAKNVSNDHDFTKLFTPSSGPSISPSSSPSLFSSFMPTTEPTPSPTRAMIKSCPDAPDEIELAKFEVAFDYEIVTASTVDISLAISAMEELILKDVAGMFLNCGESEQAIRRKLEDTTEKILRIDSAPTDVINRINAVCLRDTVVGESENKICTPINGAMTFFSSCATCLFPTEDVLMYIEAGFDSGTYLDKDIIEDIGYVGTNEAVVTTILSSSESNTSKVGMSFGVISAVAALLILGGFVFKRRSRKHRDLANVDLDVESIDSIDEEIDFVNSAVNLKELLFEEEEEGINICL